MLGEGQAMLAWSEWMAPVSPRVVAEGGILSNRTQGPSRELVQNSMFKGHHIR